MKSSGSSRNGEWNSSRRGDINGKSAWEALNLILRLKATLGLRRVEFLSVFFREHKINVFGLRRRQGAHVLVCARTRTFYAGRFSIPRCKKLRKETLMTNNENLRLNSFIHFLWRSGERTQSFNALRWSRGIEFHSLRKSSAYRFSLCNRRCDLRHVEVVRKVSFFVSRNVYHENRRHMLMSN